MQDSMKIAEQWLRNVRFWGGAAAEMQRAILFWTARRYSLVRLGTR
jgi:hypothetical protein